MKYAARVMQLAKSFMKKDLETPFLEILKEAKSNIEIIPSDILENIYRNDFTHVIWMNR